MSLLHQVTSKIKEGGCWVRLYDNMRIFVFNEDESIYYCKFIPCAKNAGTYEIKKEDVVELIMEEDEPCLGKK